MARKPKVNTTINGKEYFRTTLTLGYDSSGTQIQKQFYGRTKGEAEEKKQNYIYMLENGINPDLGILTLDNAINEWLWNIERYSGIKSSTFERYESIYRNHIKDSMIGRIQVSEVNKMIIQRYYNELLDSGKSTIFLDKLNKFLSKFFKFAQSEGYIVRNPIYGLKLPKKDEDDINYNEREIETFTDEEIKNILAALDPNSKTRYIVLFAVMTGARMGEILPLEKDDIVGDVVRINKTLRTVRVYTDKDKYSYEQKITRPKSESSIREVPIPERLKAELKNLDILVKEERLRLGPDYKPNKLLFPSITGTYIDDKNLRTSWKRALNRANIPYKKFHALRHTYATRMIENGVELLTVSRLLGHSTIKTTEVYAHTSEESKIKAVQTLNSLFD